MENEKDVNAESSTAQDVNAESSTVENQSEEATSQKATEVPFNEHPRFKELISEKNELKVQLGQALEALKSTRQPNETQNQQIEQKIYEATTPDEKRFWETVEKIAEAKADSKIKEKESIFKSEINSVYQAYGKLAANEFLRNHPDVQKGSKELEDIWKYATKNNVDPDDAYKIVMFDRNASLAVEKEKKKSEDLNKQKKAANVETKTINSNTFAPKKHPGKSIDMEDMLKSARELGIEI